MSRYVKEPHLDSHDVKPVLRSLLEGLLKRDESFALDFFKDRRTLERVAKIIVGSTTLHHRTPCSRAERSAGLHCAVLACRLARMDDFASERFLPILIAGALSGVVAYGLTYGAVSKDGANMVGHDENKPDAAAATNAVLSSVQKLVSHSLVYPLVSYGS